jgi:hypothetical protein
MRTTLNIPDRIVREAKQRALEEGTTLTQIIVEGLESRLERGSTAGPLPISRAVGGVCAGIDWGRLAPVDAGEEAYR